MKSADTSLNISGDRVMITANILSNIISLTPSPFSISRLFFRTAALLSFSISTPYHATFSKSAIIVASKPVVQINNIPTAKSHLFISISFSICFYSMLSNFFLHGEVIFLKIISFTAAKAELDREKKDSELTEHFKAVEKLFPGASEQIRKETHND